MVETPFRRLLEGFNEFGVVACFWDPLPGHGLETASEGSRRCYAVTAAPKLTACWDVWQFLPREQCLIAEERRKDDDGTEVDDGSSDSQGGTRSWKGRLSLNGYFR